uniref:peptidoglycan-binding domain-containing protein n=1 Tax=Microvirga roseola TaxID=2883126 RepID=UPI001E2E6E4B
AARNFQQAQGLEPTGQLDIALINALGMNQQVFQPNIQGGGQAGQQTAQGGGQQGQSAGQAQGGQQGQRVAQEQSQGEGTPLYASPAAVREITQALNKAGYSGGNVNGQWDDGTEQATKNFQQAKGLEPTGTLTTETMAALGMTNWMQGGQGGSPTSTGAVGGGASGGSMGGAGGSMGQQGGAMGAQPGMNQQGGQGAGQSITITPQQKQ